MKLDQEVIFIDNFIEWALIEKEAWQFYQALIGKFNRPNVRVIQRLNNHLVFVINPTRSEDLTLFDDPN